MTSLSCADTVPGNDGSRCLVVFFPDDGGCIERVALEVARRGRAVREPVREPRAQAA